MPRTFPSISIFSSSNTEQNRTQQLACLEKEEEERNRERERASMASLLGEAITRTSDLPTTHRLQQDAAKKDEEELMEKLKKELKEKHRESNRLYAESCRMIFEWNKMDFTRTMDKAWLTNEIISERCPADLSDDRSAKAGVFNKQIGATVALGLDGIMFGPSRKRKASSLEKEEEASDEDLEELRDLKSLHEEAVLQMVETDRDEVREMCKIIYICARPFAKLEDREKYLSSLIESLLERGREIEREKEERKPVLHTTEIEKREREERKPVVPTTEIEILGYMLLEEIVNSTLQHPYINLTPYTPPVPVIPKLEKSRNSLTLASIRGGEEPPKIQVSIDHPTFYTLNGKWSFEELVAADYDSLLIKAKSAGNHSEMEQMKWMLAKVEEQIEMGKVNCRDIFPKVLSQMSAIRSFESRLVVFCEDLSYMRYGRCLNAFSNTENEKLKEIRGLARNAINKYKEAKGPDSVPVCPISNPDQWTKYCKRWKHLSMSTKT